jgi:serine protease AprX
MIDAGFYKQHTVFQHILDNDRLIAERDFVFNDKNVQDETTADTTKSGPQHSHGTSVWSLIGGYEPGVLIGAAYNAEFLLAKSEYIGSETIVEEDWYVQAVEWAEAKGADIISTSVAYRDFDDPEDDHSFEDLDGITTPVAQVINWVFERGVLPVICAGNSGNVPKFADGGLLTPSDAIGALTAGAVDSDGSLASFSSHGPTTDGRIKPDLCAMGVANHVASCHSAESYTTGSGTSYSTPLIAGAAALLLEKYPHLTPVYLIELMKAHATRASVPDNRYGWGIPDIYAAIIEGDSAAVHNFATARKRLYTFPNPSKSAVSFLFQWSQITPATNSTLLKVYNLLGAEIWSTVLSPQIAGIKETVAWDLKNFSGEIVPSGIYIVVVRDGHTTIRGKCMIYH